MGRSTLPLALAELAQPSSPGAQVVALRNLKNEIVGHEQRKELAVVHGVVRPLAALLGEGVRRGGKQQRHGNGVASDARSASVSASVSASAAVSAWTSDDELRFQTTLVVGSLANGEQCDSAPPLLFATRPG